jgi:hypothetical protein
MGRLVIGRDPSIPVVVGIDVSSQIHGVVQHSTDDQHVAIPTTDEKVPWTADPTARGMSAAL